MRYPRYFLFFNDLILKEIFGYVPTPLGLAPASIGGVAPV
jgi:hypothetical protein